jgi:hypothetical protein
MTNGRDAIDTIVDTLAPVLGEHMSRSAVVGTFDKMGIRREAASPEDIEKLVHSLELGLNVFVGRVKSKVLVEELHRKLKITPK